MGSVFERCLGILMQMGNLQGEVIVTFLGAADISDRNVRIVLIQTLHIFSGIIIAASTAHQECTRGHIMQQAFRKQIVKNRQIQRIKGKDFPLASVPFIDFL